MHVIINGVSSETLQGVQVLSLPPITKPRMRTSVAVIDGRPGDIVTRLGYEAYNRKIQILLHHDYDIDAISAFFNTSGTIIFSNEPDMEYEFETIDAFSFERAVRYKTADITFHVQPYKLSATEEPATGEVSTLVDKTPYIIRRTPFGTRQKGTIVGGSIVFNQIINDNAVVANSGTKTWDATNKEYTITATNLSAPTFGYYSSTNIAPGHVAFISEYLNPSAALPSVKFGITSTPLHTIALSADVYTNITAVVKNETTSGKSVINYHNLSTLGLSELTIKVKNLFAIDLTILFGPTAADYIYAQEQASAGAGVALAKAWAGITADYYPYDSGSIKSVEGLTAHRMTGKNLVPMLKNSTHLGVTFATNADGSITATGQATGTTNVSIWHGYIMSGRYTLSGCPTGGGASSYQLWIWDVTDGKAAGIEDRGNGATGELLEGHEYDIRIRYASGYTANQTFYPMLRYADVQDATFEPYTAHEYPLDSSLTLRGLPKLDGDNLYYDGDVYKADGTVERRYGVVDLGTLNWLAGSDNVFYSTGLSTKKPGNWNILCSAYSVTTATATSGMQDKECKGHGSFRYIYIRDTAYTTASEFKTAMNGVYLLYELETTTTEQAEPYTALQICDPAGTEEWVGASMPVGHETAYIDPISMTVTNEGNTESAPSITIEGEGPVEVTVDGLNILQIQMPASGEITIDSRTLDATDGEGGLANRSVTGDYNDLRLTPGEHTVTVTGDVTSVTLKNTSRWI